MGPHTGMANELGVVRIKGKIGSAVESVSYLSICPVIVVTNPKVQSTTES